MTSYTYIHIYIYKMYLRTHWMLRVNLGEIYRVFCGYICYMVVHLHLSEVSLNLEIRIWHTTHLMSTIALTFRDVEQCTYEI